MDDVKVTFSTMMKRTPYGNSTAPFLDSMYDAIFIIGLMLLSAETDTTICLVMQESGLIAEDDMLPLTWWPADMFSSPIHRRLLMYLQQ